MKPTLYHYVHCPFCIRVRMALGYLNLEYKSVVVPYNDEETPIKLTGKKMLPALTHEKGAMNESLDIIAFVDKDNILMTKEIAAKPEFKMFEDLLNAISSPAFSLCMPYWIWTPEFDDQSRAYFQKKKEEKRGPFKELVKNRENLITTLNDVWPRIEKELKPFYQSSTLGLHDLLLASHLWGLYVVPEFQFPTAVHIYLQRIKQECRFNYHEDFWK